MIFKMKLKKQQDSKIKGAGVVLYKGNTVLILQKPNGKFDIPKGHSDDSDLNELQTAQRECFEETDIFFGVNDLLTNEVYKADRLFVFCATTNQEPKLKENPETSELEHTGFFWVDPDTAERILPKYLSRAILWSRQFQ